MPPPVTSPLLLRPGSVPADGVDSAVAAHYGDPLREQRLLARAAGWVDRSHRGVLAVPGPDRLAWLHDVTSQHLRGLPEGAAAETLVLSPHGHVEHHAVVTELGGTAWLDVEPGTAPALLAYLESMRFMLRVEPRDATGEYATLSLVGPGTAAVLVGLGVPALPGLTEDAAGPRYGVVSLAGGGWVRRMPSLGGVAGAVGADLVEAVDLAVPRDLLPEVADRLTGAGAQPAGLWAYEALRVAARRPRLGMDTDHRTIPHEVGWIGTAVHLEKGCYRGQETVARVHNLGRPPRRLVLLHLSGLSEELPSPGEPVESAGRPVGRVGTAVRHYEAGQIALALMKRSVSDKNELTVRGAPVTLEPDPAEPAEVAEAAEPAKPARPPRRRPVGPPAPPRRVGPT
jgi:folate-binding protein YgfZ